MFGHDRSPLQSTRSFHVYGNRTRVREDSLTSIGPIRNSDRRHKHDQSAQSNPRPDQNRATERPQDQGAENTLKLLHDPELRSRLAGSNFSSLSELVEKAANVETVLEAERKTIQHSGGHTKFSKEKDRNSTRVQDRTKAKGEDSEAKPIIVVTLGYVTHVISRDIFQGFVPKTS
ncbi:hypothetical protein F2Q70_00011789 [Brassica cretica]|uniref:Uncharacterized protein n=1 Tax=Brassica cretica TaxID=69181 RepID=A0A8S9LZA2_BRACR|nr:hypothetical protein F2Q70_00011789 [Brassica cretica]